MPELPEVETIARGLARELTGATIRDVPHARDDYVLGPSPKPVRLLPGRRISAIRRHGKRLIVDLAPGGQMIIHLGMSGQLVTARPEEAVQPHTHLRVRFRGRRPELRLRDPRRFGGVWISPGGDEPTITSAARNGARPGPLGPDALTIGEEEFTALLRRGRQLKALLLDQATLAGLGNIYVDEALWAVRLHPLLPADRIRPPKARELHATILRILNEAIAAGGSTLRDYRNASGGEGEFQEAHQVYGRKDEPCPRCGARIRRILVAARSTHVCGRCQRAPRG